jgi:hypothetical protein
MAWHRQWNYWRKRFLICGRQTSGATLGKHPHAPQDAKDQSRFSGVSGPSRLHDLRPGARAIGRIFKDRTRPELRWYWSITMIGARHAGIQTDGHSPTLEQAQAELQANWRKCLVSAKLEEQE